MADDANKCEHNWVFVDDSFSHEYGTETIVYWYCEKCSSTKEVEPGDYIIDDFE